MRCSIVCSAPRSATCPTATRALSEWKPQRRKSALGACAYARAVEELTLQVDPPDVIVHSTSSGGTQAGLVAGCLLHGLTARVIGISADEASSVLSRDIAAIVAGMPEVLQIPGDSF